MSLTCEANFAVISNGAAETERLGQLLGECAEPDLTVGLSGDLGAGKTCFVRGIAKGLGVDNQAGVTSPTFVLVQQFDGRMPLFHFDAYRLAVPDHFPDLGTEEYFFGGGVCAIEWADRVIAFLPDDCLRIRFDHEGENTRILRISAHGMNPRRIADGWQASLSANGYLSSSQGSSGGQQFSLPSSSILRSAAASILNSPDKRDRMA